MECIIDKKYTDKLHKQIIKVYNDETRLPDGKFHVSDIVYPLGAYGRAIYGKPEKLTKEEVGMFFLGKAVHEHIQRILGREMSEVTKEEKISGITIVGTIDHLGKRPLEIKTSRKWTIPEWPAPHYIRQAAYYAVIFNLKEITILVIYPTAGRKYNNSKSSTLEIGAWTLKFNDEDKKAIRYDMQRSMEELKKAIKKKNPKNLPPAPKFITEKFGGKLDKYTMTKEEEFLEMEHPFYYAWKEKGWL